MIQLYNDDDFNDNDFDSVEYEDRSGAVEDDFFDDDDYGCRPNEDTLGPCIGKTATLEDMDAMRDFEDICAQRDAQREFDSMREKGF